MTTSTTNSQKSNKAPHSYLVFNDFHFATMRDLSPDSIKHSAKEASQNSVEYVHGARDKLKVTTAQNWIAKTLGFKGGFSSYKKHYHESLTPFMKQHGLKIRADVCSFRRKGYALPLTPITRQNVAERLFYGCAKLPNRIFTGYNFPFDKTISDGHYLINCTYHADGSEISQFGIKALHNLSQSVVAEDLMIADKFRHEKLERVEDDYYVGREVIDVILGKYLLDLNAGFNLIGDVLVEPNIYGPELQLYSPNHDKSFADECESLQKISALFGERIREFHEGWVEVIPYNKNLIFLKGSSGEYDFIFKNMRDNDFVFNLDDGALKLRDMPSCIDEYDFERWFYFLYEGQRELDTHHAEQLHYESGGSARDYPDDTLMKAFYQENEVYELPRAEIKKALPMGVDFKRVNGTPLMVSELVSIEMFELFCSENPEYCDYRAESMENLNDLEYCNSDEDKSLPAACSWYDAMAFLNWIEKKTGLPVKLLSKTELESEREKGVLLNVAKEEQGDSILPEDEKLKKALVPKIMPMPCDVNVVRSGGLNWCKFPKQLEWDITPDGLRFLLLNYFAEWVMEKTCIRSGNLTSFYGDDCYRGVSLTTTGAYKNTKIGFRMCYSIG